MFHPGISCRHAAPLLKLGLVRALASGLALGTFAYEEPLSTLHDHKRTASFAVEYKDQSGDYYFLVRGCSISYYFLVRGCSISRASSSELGAGGGSLEAVSK